MSRIDQALRRWEGSFGVDQAHQDNEPSATATPLHRYVREGGPSRLPSPEPPPELSPEPPSYPREPEQVARPVRVVRRGRPAPAPDPALEARLVTGQVSPVALEQYRRLAAALHDAQAEGGLKTVMLTSAVPNEGKTLTSVNLALTLSASYARRVLLIDADLRWPSVHVPLGISNTRGLTEVLADDGLEWPVVKVSERLTVLPAGRPGPTPLAGLSSPRMGTILEECSRRFDWVLLDTPPVGLLPDAQVLARLVGAVIVVIGAGSTPAATVERTVAEIGQERIIGTVMNRVEGHRISEAGFYDRYESRE
jgi:capsular exopolysaccharide synthesis family protein